MLENEKEKSSMNGDQAQNILCPCPTHGNTGEDRWIFHTVINLKCGNEDRSVVPVQPQGKFQILAGIYCHDCLHSFHGLLTKSTWPKCCQNNIKLNFFPNFQNIYPNFSKN